MTPLVIDGGEPLSGSIPISGAKNAALPACVASLLTEEPVILHSVPQLRDISTILYTLGALGKRVVRHGESVAISRGTDLVPEANAYSVRQMRASFLVLGPLVARLGRAVVPLPGGCAIGSRPVDLHLDGLRALGAHVEEQSGLVTVSADRLVGTRITLPVPSVGATEQIIMAACLADGETTIHNASIEPEVVDLIDLLRKMGASILVDGRDFHVQGRSRLVGAEHALIPDRMEAGTMLLAGAITGGSVSVSPVVPEHLGAFLDCMRNSGAELTVGERSVTVSGSKRPEAIRVKTSAYPGFPTDLHPPLAALLSIADGASWIDEDVFERRFAYTSGLCTMGARIVQDGRAISIHGVRDLVGASVEAPDIRGGAALILAGLAARGRTVVAGMSHIDRGYANLEKKLSAVGAHIERREKTA